MAGMDVDPPPADRSPVFSPRDRIVQKLVQLGVPLDQDDPSPSRLVEFVQQNPQSIPNLVCVILPGDEEVAQIRRLLKKEPGGGPKHVKLKELYTECLLWIQWLMFRSDPQGVLADMANQASGRRAVCGAVWGQNDLAYRCRTCEHDPTCAICVTCFKNGNHRDHDYSIMYTGGGCCDCGDETAWKPEGFCSKHTGTQQIQPLSEELVNSVGPVIDVLLACWRDKIIPMEHLKRAKDSTSSEIRKGANDLSTAVINMLIDFCNCSESLLSFVSKRIFECPGLLHVLVRGERILDKEVAKKLYELLLKLLGEPVFKYEFAKVLVKYYPIIVNEIIKECSDSMLERFALLPTFSVQIFTVPTLTPRLVREVDLLGVLLDCLTDLLLSCLGEDGRLQVNRWANVYETTLRLVEDTRYVMSHSEVAVYVAQGRPDLSKAWLRLLSLVQGMDPQKRVTGIHTEEDNDNVSAPFVLGYYLGNAHTLLVGGAFSLDNSKDQIGGNNQQSLEADCDSQTDQGNFRSIPCSAVWLTLECLKTIESCLELDYGMRCDLHSLDAPSSSGSSVLTFRTQFFGRTSMDDRAHRRSISEEDGHVPASHERIAFSPQLGEREETLVRDNHHMDVCDCYDTIPEFPGEGISPDNNEDMASLRKMEAFRLFNTSDWPDIMYDVSSQEISFHIPLHRLLSLLLRKALRSFYEETGMLVKAYDYSYKHNFFGHVLKGVHPFGFSCYIMESPLRLRVFCAQVRAGMWRKNGDAAILSCEWYRNVQWLEIGLEPDLFLLQICAALAPPDAFVKRILERFGLENYLSLVHAGHNEYEAVLVQEMLTLLIQIVKERRFCGLSVTENLKRELVYKLAVGDATHSQLVKSLPRDLSKSVQLRSMLDTLAVYSKPSGMKQGKYSLKKAFWQELDLYHPRWNSRELQVAEERYFRFCKVSALNAQLPHWTAIFEPMHSISRIATSMTVLDIVRAVFFYAVSTEVSSLSRAPDGVLITALHLLSLALDTCETQLSSDPESEFPLLTFAGEDISSDTTNDVSLENQSCLSLLVSLMRKHREEGAYNYAEIRQCNIASLIEDLLKKFALLSPTCLNNLKRLAPEMTFQTPLDSVSSAMDSSSSTSDLQERKAKARARQAAIMEKMKAEQSKFVASLKSEEALEEPDLKKPDHRVSISDHAPEESEAICSLCRGSDSESPLCFLVLLQKSRLISSVERGPISWDDIDQSNKGILLNAKKGVDDSFSEASSNLDQMVQVRGLNVADGTGSTEAHGFHDLFGEWLPENGDARSYTVYFDTSGSSQLPQERLENNLYQSVIREVHSSQYDRDAIGELHPSSHESKSMAYEPRDSGSSVPMKTSKSHQSYVQDTTAKLSASTVPTTGFSGLGPKDCDGIHISSCGHAVHQECHDRYLTSLKQRYLRRLGFEGGHIVDPDLGELLCPVCRRFANSILPVVSCGLPNGACTQNKPLIGNQKESLCLPLAVSLLRSTAKIIGYDMFQRVPSAKKSVNVKQSLEPALRKLCTMYSHRYDYLASSGKLIQSLNLWDTFVYSLVSTEIAARGKPTKSAACSSLSLEALYGELHSSNEFVLSLLLRVAQNTRVSSQHDVLIRFWGVQLLAASICFGVSGDRFLPSDKKKGTSSSLFLLLDKEEDSPDTLFIKRAADPILAHDPFSSLMLALFCLPSPFISSSEFFIPLVHLFYCVCVVQALLTCYGGPYFDVSCFGDSVLNDICKMMAKSEFVRKYFVSNYIEFSCHPKDTIRRFTFPYLRRCALLWKMLQSSTSGPLYESNPIWASNPYTKDTILDSSIAAELNEIKELEDLFQIHSLEVVLKDEVMHALALKWCDHFSGEFGIRNYRPALFSSPAVPFKLIKLPHLYQDLLQRYIKLPCSSCKSIPDEPVLCLVCGKLCSPNWKFCCRESRCLNHAMTCGAGVAVFLSVRRTNVFLQRSLRESSWPSPYLDAFGEEDRDMHRGKPLFLNEERYAALTYLVASHGLDRTSEVLRQTTISLNGAD